MAFFPISDFGLDAVLIGLARVLTEGFKTSICLMGFETALSSAATCESEQGRRELPHAESPSVCGSVKVFFPGSISGNSA